MESRPGLKLGGLDSRISLDSMITLTLLLWQKVADLKIYLFSATKQDRVGSSLLSRNTLFTFCSLLYTMYRGTGSVDYGDTLCESAANIVS